MQRLKLDPRSARLMSTEHFVHWDLTIVSNNIPYLVDREIGKKLHVQTSIQERHANLQMQKKEMHKQNMPTTCALIQADKKNIQTDTHMKMHTLTLT